MIARYAVTLGVLLAALPAQRMETLSQSEAVRRVWQSIVERPNRSVVEILRADDVLVLGTVVAPDAGVKVFLTASTRERARRRALETDTDIDEVEADIIRRDALDSTREESPLQKADDAVMIDTTGVAIPEVVAAIVQLIDDEGIR